MKYIDADKLRALIDEKWRKLADENVKVGGGKWDAEISTCLSVIRLIDSLQQERPEVDFEKEIDFFLYGTYTPERFPNTMQVRDEHTGLKVNDWKWQVNNPGHKVEFARHFYELGIKSRKEE